MGNYDALETNVERLDPLRHDSILQVLEILPLALTQPHKIFGTGTRFIVGAVSVMVCQPISIYGIAKVVGEDLLQCLYNQASLTLNMSEAYLDPLRAAIGDGLKYTGMHKIEFLRKPASPIEIDTVLGQIAW
jgi:hypothetical protein